MQLHRGNAECQCGGERAAYGGASDGFYFYLFPFPFAVAPDPEAGPASVSALYELDRVLYYRVYCGQSGPASMVQYELVRR